MSQQAEDIGHFCQIEYYGNYMEYYSIHKFSRLIGRTPQTLRNWDSSGRLKPHHKGPNGYRYYSSQQLDEVLGVVDQPKKVIGYCRVSCKKQKGDLEGQILQMEAHLSTLGSEYEILHDIGSGLNYRNRGLSQLIRRIVKREVREVVVFYEDSLLRYGFELVKYIAALHGCEVVVLNRTDGPEQEELARDLVRIITIFSNRLQDDRAEKAHRLIRELSEQPKLSGKIHGDVMP